jgi:hypothetical protein
MFKIGDLVRVKQSATNEEIDYHIDLIGKEFTVEKIDGRYILLSEPHWWVDLSCLEFIKVFTKEDEILYKIAVIYKRFEERKG